GPVTEAQLNLIKKKWEDLKVAGKTFNAEVSLSLNGEVELSDGKVESIKRSVQAELELELSKRTSLKFEVKKEETVYTNKPPATPPEEPEVTVGISRKIGGGDDKKEKREKWKKQKQETARAGKEELEKARQKYEKTRDAIIAPLRKEIQ